jgi:hypothetical protein
MASIASETKQATRTKVFRWLIDEWDTCLTPPNIGDDTRNVIASQDAQHSVPVESIAETTTQVILMKD